MPEPLSWMLAAVAGLLIGAFFFGGLWWTVRKGLSSQHPALLFTASLLLRMGVAMVGIYWVGQAFGHSTEQPAWPPLMLCLLGFVLARPLVLGLTRSRPPPRSATEARHAA